MRLLLAALALLLMGCTAENPDMDPAFRDCYHAHPDTWQRDCPVAQSVTPDLGTQDSACDLAMASDRLPSDAGPACVPLQTPEGPCGCEAMPCCLGACNAGMRCSGSVCVAPTPPDMLPPPDMTRPPGTPGAACVTVADCIQDMGYDSYRCMGAPDTQSPTGKVCCYEIPNHAGIRCF